MFETPTQSDGKGVCTPKYNQVLTQPTDENDSKREFKLKRKKGQPCVRFGEGQQPKRCDVDSLN